MICLDERVLQRYYLCLNHSRNIAGSGFRRLSNIPHCCILMDTGPFLSSSVAGRSPKPTKDHRLGKLLPYQQSNPRQANFVATSIFCKTAEVSLLNLTIGTFVLRLQRNTQYFPPTKHFPIHYSPVCHAT